MESDAAGCGTSYEIPSASKSPGAVAFSPDGSYLVTANQSSNDVTLFSVSGGVLNGGTSYALPSGSVEPYSVAFSPNGSCLATANYGSNNVTLFSLSGGVLSGGTSYALPSGTIAPQSVAFSPNGSYLATASAGSGDVTDPHGGVTLFDVAEGVLSGGTTYTSAPANSVSFSPNNSYLAVAYASSPESATGDITILSLSGGVVNQVNSYALPSGSTEPYSIAFSPDGSYLAIANNGTNNVTIFTVSSGALNGGTSYALPTNSTDPKSLSFSPDGDSLAIACAGSGVTDSNDGVVLFTVSSGILGSGTFYASGSEFTNSVAFSPDGSYLATANINSDNVTLFTIASLCSMPAPTGSASNSSSASGCSTGCIAGVAVGGVAVLAAAVVTGILLRKYYCTPVIVMPADRVNGNANGQAPAEHNDIESPEHPEVAAQAAGGAQLPAQGVMPFVFGDDESSALPEPPQVQPMAAASIAIPEAVVAGHRSYLASHALARGRPLSEGVDE